MKNFKQRDHERENGPTRLGPSGIRKATQGVAFVFGLWEIFAVSNFVLFHKTSNEIISAVVLLIYFS